MNQQNTTSRCYKTRPESGTSAVLFLVSIDPLSASYC